MEEKLSISNRDFEIINLVETTRDIISDEISKGNIHGFVGLSFRSDLKADGMKKYTIKSYYESSVDEPRLIDKKKIPHGYTTISYIDEEGNEVEEGIELEYIEKSIALSKLVSNLIVNGKGDISDVCNPKKKGDDLEAKDIYPTRSIVYKNIHTDIIILDSKGILESFDRRLTNYFGRKYPNSKKEIEKLENDFDKNCPENIMIRDWYNAERVKEFPSKGYFVKKT